MSGRRAVRNLMPVALGALLLATAAPAAPVAAHGTTSARAATLDLGAALDADGVFRGLEGLSGSVDLTRWTLVSDLSRGEPPRFAAARRRNVGPAAVAGWSDVASSAGNAAFSQGVLALVAKKTLLYLGGDFFSPLGAGDADGLAAWDGSSLSAIGSTNSILDDSVYAIAIDGPDLYVGGTFQNADGMATADRIAKWDGGTSSWQSLGGGLLAPVNAIAVDGNDIYVGGDFTNADGIATADYIARYDGAWHAMGSRAGNGAIADHVNAIAISGGNVYVGGLFTNANGDAKADYVARWDGAWHRMGANGANGALGDQVYALLVDGLDLYVGGNFQNVAGVATTDFVARWRNGAWNGLGSNGGNGSLDARVYALAEAGGDIYVGGHFLDADGIVEADHVARWDGSDWHALGSNGAGDGAIGNTVYALAAFEGQLYVGGVFLDAAGINAADYLASWVLPDSHLPDGRVRQGTSGTFKGDDIRNSGGKHQQLTVHANGGTWITYQVSAQNDSATLDDTFKIQSSGAANTDFIFKVLEGAVVITPGVENGTYHTGVATPGNDRKIKIRIKVKASALAGETFTRTITITSDGDPGKVDVIKVVAHSDN